MGIVNTADALDGSDLLVLFHLGDLLHTGTDNFTVDDDRTGAAGTHAAADLRAGQADTTQNICQGILGRITDEHPVSAVDVQRHLFEIHFFLRIDY